MKETIKQLEAFDTYYKLGSDRSYQKVADHHNVTKRTVVRWGKEFHWQERVSLRDIETDSGAIKQTNTDVIDLKAKRLASVGIHLQEIPKIRSYLTQVLINSSDLIKSGKLRAKDTKELGEVIRALGSVTKDELELQKFEQVLLGEADSRADDKVVIVFQGLEDGDLSN